MSEDGDRCFHPKPLILFSLPLLVSHVPSLFGACHSCVRLCFFFASAMLVPQSQMTDSLLLLRERRATVTCFFSFSSHFPDPLTPAASPPLLHAMITSVFPSFHFHFRGAAQLNHCSERSSLNIAVRRCLHSSITFTLFLLSLTLSAMIRRDVSWRKAETLEKGKKSHSLCLTIFPKWWKNVRWLWTHEEAHAESPAPCLLVIMRMLHDFHWCPLLQHTHTSTGQALQESQRHGSYTCIICDLKEWTFI